MANLRPTENVDKLIGILKKLSSLEGDCPKKKVATHPLKAEWKVIYEEFEALFEEKKKISEKVDKTRAKFWNKVEGDLEIFDKQLKINVEENVIEVYEDDCDSCDEEKTTPSVEDDVATDKTE